MNQIKLLELQNFLLKQQLRDANSKIMLHEDSEFELNQKIKKANNKIKKFKFFLVLILFIIWLALFYFISTWSIYPKQYLSKNTEIDNMILKYYDKPDEKKST